MGSFDTIHGEAVKCFPWVAYSAGPLLGSQKIDYYTGSQKAYKNGDVVPYKTGYYNYTPNFIVIDTNPEDSENIAFVLHIVKNGRVLTTIQVTQDAQNLYQENPSRPADCNINQYFQTNNHVVSYTGDPMLNIHSITDCHEYAKQLEQLRFDILEATKESQKLYKEYRREANGLGKLKRGSKERQKKDALISAKRTLYHKALEKEQPKAQELAEEFAKIWAKEDPYEFEKELGAWLTAGMQLESKHENIFKTYCKDFKETFPDLSKDTLEKYHTWHESTKNERSAIVYLLFQIENEGKTIPTHTGM